MLSFSPVTPNRAVRGKSSLAMADGLKIDMRGKTVFVAGVADSTGYGWAIAKACAEVNKNNFTIFANSSLLLDIKNY